MNKDKNGFPVWVAFAFFLIALSAIRGLDSYIKNSSKSSSRLDSSYDTTKSKEYNNLKKKYGLN